MTASGGVSYAYPVFHAGFDLKLPITISNKIKFYPMLGLDAAIGGDTFKYFTYGPHGGVGADFLLLENMFIRGNVLYAYRIDSDKGNDFTGDGGGILLRACVGWRF